MRLSKVFVAVAALAAVGTSYAASVTTVSAGPANPVGALMNVGFRTALEYVVTTDDPAGTFAAFCLDPGLKYFGAGPEAYTKATVAQANQLSILFTGANWRSWDYTNDGVTTAAQQQGLGLAVWDIMTDDGNLMTGNFKFAGGAASNDGYGGAAYSFVQNAQATGNTGWANSLIRLDLTNPNLQDLVIAVPEPSTYAMLLAGLAGVGFVARRRQQRG